MPINNSGDGLSRLGALILLHPSKSLFEDPWRG
jgi:hypothetical protein